MPKRSTYAEIKEFAPDNEYIFHESVNDLLDAIRSYTPINDTKILYLAVVMSQLILNQFSRYKHRN